MVQKLDLAEKTRYCQAGFEDAMPTLRGDSFGCNVVLRPRWGHLVLCCHRP
jgi:hypothetical protein